MTQPSVPTAAVCAPSSASALGLGKSRAVPGPAAATPRSPRRRRAFLLANSAVSPIARLVSTRAARAPDGSLFRHRRQGHRGAARAKSCSELGLPAVRAARGGVYFGRERASDAYRACLWSRIALRVLEPLPSFECRDGDDLYEGVKSIDWSRVPRGERTLAVRAAGRNDQLTHTHYIAVRAKDAIVDQLREQRGAGRASTATRRTCCCSCTSAASARPSTSTTRAARCTSTGFAPRGRGALRETLAAALVRFSGWKGDSPLWSIRCAARARCCSRRGCGRRAARRASRARALASSAGARSMARRGRSSSDCEPRPAPASGPRRRCSARTRIRERSSNVAANAERARLSVSCAACRSLASSRDGKPARCSPTRPMASVWRGPEHLERDLDALLERFAALAARADRAARVSLAAARLAFQAVFNGPIECELRSYDASRPRLSFRPRERGTADPHLTIQLHFNLSKRSPSVRAPPRGACRPTMGRLASTRLVKWRSRGYAGVRSGALAECGEPAVRRTKDKEDESERVSRRESARIRPAPVLRNVYACLVHESQECVIDLVRNLRCLDPDSSVLLYNGGAGRALLEPVILLRQARRLRSTPRAARSTRARCTSSRSTACATRSSELPSTR